MRGSPITKIKQEITSQNEFLLIVNETGNGLISDQFMINDAAVIFKLRQDHGSHPY